MDGDGSAIGVGSHVEVVADVPMGRIETIDDGDGMATVEIELGPSGLPSPVTLRVVTDPETARRVVDGEPRLLLVVANGEG